MKSIAAGWARVCEVQHRTSPTSALRPPDMTARGSNARNTQRPKRRCKACGRWGHEEWQCELLAIKLCLDAYLKRHPDKDFKEVLQHWAERNKEFHGLRDRRSARPTRGRVSSAQAGTVEELWDELNHVQNAFHFATNNAFADIEPAVLLSCIDYTPMSAIEE